MKLLILAVLAIAALFWARVVYGLIFRDNGARPGDPSWVEPYGVPDAVSPETPQGPAVLLGVPGLLRLTYLTPGGRV